MDEETINFLRALCGKARELFALCETYLSEQALRKNKPRIPGIAPEEVKQPEQVGNRFIRLVDWPKYHPWPKVSSFRSLVYHDWLNGSDFFKKKVGRSLLIDEKKFFEWVNMSEGDRLKNSPAMQAFKAKFNCIGNRRLNK